MSYTSDAPTVGLLPRPDRFFTPRNTGGTTASQAVDILTYSHGSRMVYVTPGEDYDRAIDIAVDCFPELIDVERARISLEVRVPMAHMQRSRQRTVEIGRTAWPLVVAVLERFQVVEVRVAPPPPPPPPPPPSLSSFVLGPSGSTVEPPPYTPVPRRHGYSEDAQSNFVAYRARRPVSPAQAPLRFMPPSSSPVAELPPYEPEAGRFEYSENAQTNFVAYGGQMPSSPQPHSRGVNVVPPWSSQGRHDAPQLR